MRRLALLLFLWLASATAAPAQDATPLTAADIKYLAALGQSQEALSAIKPTPKDLERLHQLINDPALAGKPKAREDAVWKVLDHIQAQFLWCSDHPGDKDCGGAEKASAQ